MKKLLILILCTIYSSSFSQRNTYDVAFSYGIYTAPNFKQSHFKDYFQADFNYHLATRWTITSGFTAGQFNYYDDIRSNADLEITKYTTPTTNARGYDFHAYALIKYSVISYHRFYLLVGAGIGLYTQRLKYPYRQPCSSGCAVFIGEESATTPEFPLKAEAYYSLVERISIGITIGGFGKPDFSILGAYFGPQIRIKL